MSRPLSFAPRVGWSLPWLLGGLAVTSLVLLGLLVGLLADYRRLDSERDSLARLVERQNQESPAGARSSSAADLDALETVRREVGQLNRITGVRGRPVPQVLASLERALPDAVRLQELRYRHRLGELSLVAELHDPSQLSDFLHRLEADQFFSEVLLQRQTRNRLPDGSDRLIVELRLRENAGG